jgi:hypothetical protein
MMCVISETPEYLLSIERNMVMTECLVYYAAAGAGLVVGWVAGVTNEPAAGHITSGVTGFIAGISVMVGLQGGAVLDRHLVAVLFLIYLGTMMAAHVIGNLLRRHNVTDCIYGLDLRSARLRQKRLTKH